MDNMLDESNNYEEIDDVLLQPIPNGIILLLPPPVKTSCSPSPLSEVDITCPEIRDLNSVWPGPPRGKGIGRISRSSSRKQELKVKMQPKQIDETVDDDAEEPSSEEETIQTVLKKRKGGWPKGVPRNAKKRRLLQQPNEGNRKPGWPKGVPRNREKRKLQQEDNQMSPERRPREYPKGMKRKPLQAKFNWHSSSDRMSTPTEEETTPNNATQMGPNGPSENIATVLQKLHSNNVMVAGIRNLMVEQVNQTKEIIELLTGFKNMFGECNGVETAKQAAPNAL